VHIDHLQPDQLTAGHLAAWSALQRADNAVDNPTFCPEFTQILAETRNDVEVAVLREGDRFVGFFPFHRTRRNVGLPIGWLLTDMHGFVADREVEWDPMRVVSECGLSAWRFDHLVASQQPFAPYIKAVEDAPYMDLREGYDAYVAGLRARGCSSIKRARSKARKVERELGPLRLELVDRDPTAFDAVIRWKRQQIADMHAVDMYASEWVIETLRAACRTETEGFAGMVSSLYAGDHLIAAQIGMRSHQVMSAWIPTLNPEFKKFSPGLLFHLELAKHVAPLGIRRVDLGRGQNQLKMSLRSDGIPLALGAVDRRPVNRILRHCWYKTRDLVHSTPLNGFPLRFYRRIRGWSALSSL